jgi:CcmD family protein
VVDHASQRQVAIDNGSGVAFTLTGADGSATEVVVAGKLPVGFDVASTVVVVGAGRDGRFQATEVLIPGAVAAPDPGRGLTAVMAVTMVVWLGLFGYVFRLHRKLRTLEGA